MVPSHAAHYPKTLDLTWTDTLAPWDPAVGQFI
jgi:hypothetical protein